MDEDLTTLIETVETLMDDAAASPGGVNLGATRTLLTELSLAATMRDRAITLRVAGNTSDAMHYEERAESHLTAARTAAARVR